MRGWVTERVRHVFNATSTFAPTKFSIAVFCHTVFSLHNPLVAMNLHFSHPLSPFNLLLLPRTHMSLLNRFVTYSTLTLVYTLWLPDPALPLMTWFILPAFDVDLLSWYAQGISDGHILRPHLVCGISPITLSVPKTYELFSKKITHLHQLLEACERLSLPLWGSWSHQHPDPPSSRW